MIYVRHHAKLGSYTLYDRIQGYTQEDILWDQDQSRVNLTLNVNK